MVLDTEQHVEAIADLLAPYGRHVNRWTVPEKHRDRQAVEDRLGDWKNLTTSYRGNTVLYWVGHGSADHLAHHRTAAPIDDGVAPEDIARAIGRRLHPDSEDSWAIVVLDACFSQDFARTYTARSSPATAAPTSSYCCPPPPRATPNSETSPAPSSTP